MIGQQLTGPQSRPVMIVNPNQVSRNTSLGSPSPTAPQQDGSRVAAQLTPPLPPKWNKTHATLTASKPESSDNKYKCVQLSVGGKLGNFLIPVPKPGTPQNQSTICAYGPFEFSAPKSNISQSQPVCTSTVVIGPLKSNTLAKATTSSIANQPLESSCDMLKPNTSTKVTSSLLTNQTFGSSCGSLKSNTSQSVIFRPQSISKSSSSVVVTSNFSTSLTNQQPVCSYAPFIMSKTVTPQCQPASKGAYTTKSTGSVAVAHYAGVSNVVASNYQHTQASVTVPGLVKKVASSEVNMSASPMTCVPNIGSLKSLYPPGRAQMKPGDIECTVRSTNPEAMATFRLPSSNGSMLSNPGGPTLPGAGHVLKKDTVNILHRSNISSPSTSNVPMHGKVGPISHENKTVQSRTRKIVLFIDKDGGMTKKKAYVSDSQNTNAHHLAQSSANASSGFKHMVSQGTKTNPMTTNQGLKIGSVFSLAPSQSRAQTNKPAGVIDYSDQLKAFTELGDINGNELVSGSQPDLTKQDKDLSETSQGILHYDTPPLYHDVIDFDPCKVVMRNISKHFHTKNGVVSPSCVNVRKRPWSKFLREHLSSYYREKKFSKVELCKDNYFKILRENPLTVVALTEMEKDDRPSVQFDAENKQPRRPTARKRGFGSLYKFTPKNKANAGKVENRERENKLKSDSEKTPNNSDISRPLLMSALRSPTPPMTKQISTGRDGNRRTVPLPEMDKSVMRTDAHLLSDGLKDGSETRNQSQVQETSVNQDGKIQLGVVETFGPVDEKGENRGFSLGPCVTAGMTGKAVLPGKEGSPPENYLILKTSESCYFLPVGKNAYVVPLSKAGDVVQSCQRPVASIGVQGSLNTSTKTANTKIKVIGNEPTIPVLYPESVGPRIPEVKEVKTTSTPNANRSNKGIESEPPIPVLNAEVMNPRTPERKKMKGTKRRHRKETATPRLDHSYNKLIKREPVTSGYPDDDFPPPTLSPAPSPVRVKMEPEDLDYETDSAFSGDEIAESGNAPRSPFKTVADLYRSQQDYYHPVLQAAPDDDDRKERIQKLREMLQKKEQSVEEVRICRTGTDTGKLIEDFDNI